MHYFFRFDRYASPPKPAYKQIEAVAEAAVALRALRRESMRKLNYSLRDLYRTLEQPGDNPLRDAHARLDATVRAAYGVPADADPLAFLLELNLHCAAKEKAGKKSPRQAYRCRRKNTPSSQATIASSRRSSFDLSAALSKALKG